MSVSLDAQSPPVRARPISAVFLNKPAEARSDSDALARPCRRQAHHQIRPRRPISGKRGPAGRMPSGTLAPSGRQAMGDSYMRASQALEAHTAESSRAYNQHRSSPAARREPSGRGHVSETCACGNVPNPGPIEHIDDRLGAFGVVRLTSAGCGQAAFAGAGESRAILQHAAGWTAWRNSPQRECPGKIHERHEVELEEHVGWRCDRSLSLRHPWRAETAQGLRDVANCVPCATVGCGMGTGGMMLVVFSSTRVILRLPSERARPKGLRDVYLIGAGAILTPSVRRVAAVTRAYPKDFESSSLL